MMRFVFIVILGLGVVLCSEGCVNAQVTILADLGVSEEDYCYHTKMGRALYKGISNKHCVCDGSLVEVFRIPMKTAIHLFVPNLILADCMIHQMYTVKEKLLVINFTIGMQKGQENLIHYKSGIISAIH